MLELLGGIVIGAFLFRNKPIKKTYSRPLTLKEKEENREAAKRSMIKNAGVRVEMADCPLPKTIQELDEMFLWKINNEINRAEYKWHYERIKNRAD